MPYRNGTYIAFHAEGSTDPTASDIKYYRMLKAWHAHDGVDFRFVNSHEKVAAVRDTSLASTVKRSLRARLDNSKNTILIIGKRTKFDVDFVPYEIAYAVDTCGIPIIATYVGYEGITDPYALRNLWPPALATRINNETAEVIHIAFKRVLIDDAMKSFSFRTPPGGSLVHYTRAGHAQFGIAW